MYVVSQNVCGMLSILKTVNFHSRINKILVALASKLPV